MFGRVSRLTRRFRRRVYTHRDRLERLAPSHRAKSTLPADRKRYTAAFVRWMLREPISYLFDGIGERNFFFFFLYLEEEISFSRVFLCCFASDGKNFAFRNKFLNRAIPSKRNFVGRVICFVVSDICFERVK